MHFPICIVIKADSPRFVRHHYIFNLQGIFCIVLRVIYLRCLYDVSFIYPDTLGRGPVKEHSILFFFINLGQYNYYRAVVLPDHVKEIYDGIRHGCLCSDKFIFPAHPINVICMNVV
ncbi:GfV-B6-ORF2 [Ichnoviriform fumiferanae]|uniref:GfV-B6-ORF2 n=1 Tax=Ichnoviriform fumiferanae TaxID=419435 RepID=A2PZQ6_9VIRU|nr:GfV-B6-ORF2 [Ichnoviriform fumiferanae]BAF45478.1 GfV-B6-ORF2 [Ichnoviriform fumiferanae]